MEANKSNDIDMTSLCTEYFVESLRKCTGFCQDRLRTPIDANVTQHGCRHLQQGQTSSDHGEIALCEPGSTGTIADNVFFAVDTDPEFVYFETRGPVIE